MKIRKAVIPAAGLGTRFLPATKAIPKELIPIVDKPMIQFIFEEALRSGIEEIILITARGKEAVERHFSPAPELEKYLEEKGKSDLAKLSRDLGSMCKVTPVIQEQALGLGHAVLCAREAVGNEPFAVLLGDDLIDGDPPCTAQLIDVYQNSNQSAVIGVMEVPLEDTAKYGIVGGPMIDSRLMEVKTMVEKPAPAVAPSQLACPGRYVLNPSIFDHIQKVKPGTNGEIQLTDALERVARLERLLAYKFEGTRYDTGDRLGFIEATISFALRRSDIGDGVREIVKRYADK